METSILGGRLHYNINKTDAKGVAEFLATVDNNAEPEKPYAKHIFLGLRELLLNKFLLGN